MAEFQSSPTPKGGRYGISLVATAPTTGFNPRPPRRAGATPLHILEIILSTRFNPRPPRRAGATIELAHSFHSISSVSILAHPEGRALPIMVSTFASCYFGFNPRPPRRAGATKPWRHYPILIYCFNPRPPRRAGATVNCAECNKEIKVSILAHPEGRALRRQYEQAPSNTNVSILAHPEGRALPSRNPPSP